MRVWLCSANHRSPVAAVGQVCGCSGSSVCWRCCGRCGCRPSVSEAARSTGSACRVASERAPCPPNDLRHVRVSSKAVAASLPQDDSHVYQGSVHVSALALRGLLCAFMLLWRVLFDAGFVFSREKLWTKMNDTERVLLKLIAKEICMQPTLVRCGGGWYTYSQQREAPRSLLPPPGLTRALRQRACHIQLEGRRRNPHIRHV